MTDKIKLSDVIEQNKVAAFNSAVNTLAYTDATLSVKIEEVAKLLEDLTDVRTKIAVAGDDTETAVETLWELHKLANSLLYPSQTVIHSGGIVTGTINASKISAASIACNTITASKLR